MTMADPAPFTSSDAPAFASRDLASHRARAVRLDEMQLRKAMARRHGLGDMRAAVLYGESLFQVAPSAALALQLARFHRQCRSYQQARAVLAKASAHWPDHPDMLRLQAEIAMLAKDNDRAAALWLRVLQIGPVAGVYPILQAIGCLRRCGDEAQVHALVTAYAPVLRATYPTEALTLLQTGLTGLPHDLPGLSMITGNNGTGKTTVGHVLQAIGFTIVDADTEIAVFRRQNHCSPVRFDLTGGDPKAEAQTQWDWPDDRFHAACAVARRADRPAIVIGGFGRVVSRHIAVADHVFHLTVPTHVIAKRLEKRNSPAHRPGTQGYAAALRRNARAAVPEYPATILMANRPVWQICSDILQTLGHLPKGRPDAQAHQII